MVHCIKNGRMFANIHLRASVVENLKEAIDSHCIAGLKMSQMLGVKVPSLDEDDQEASNEKDKPANTSCTPPVSSSMSATPSKPGTPSYTGLKPIILSDITASKTTPPSCAQMLVLDEGYSLLTANLTAIDEMFGGADIMSDEEEENDILVKHDRGHGDGGLLYQSGHGRYKCCRVQCVPEDDPWRQINPNNCGFHQGYKLPTGFQTCGDYCRGAFCRCLKFYGT